MQYRNPEYQKEITQKLLDYYIMVLDNIRKLKLNQMDGYLVSMKSQWGCCHAAEQLFNEYNYFKISYVFSYKLMVKPFTAYWCDAPIEVKTKKEKLLMLRKRIEILTKALEDNDFG